MSNMNLPKEWFEKLGLSFSKKTGVVNWYKSEKELLEVTETEGSVCADLMLPDRRFGVFQRMHVNTEEELNLLFRMATRTHQHIKL